MLAVVLPTPAGAQRIEARAPGRGLTVGGRVHMQLNTTSIASEPGSEALMRRARIWLGVGVTDWLDGVVQADFARGVAEPRYAFFRMSFAPFFRLSVGQFKRAFDLFELTSSSQILVVERDGAVRGVDSCAGVGGICSYSRFTEQLELASLDIGMQAEGSFGDGRLEYLLTLTNGPGANERDENSLKSVSGRLVYAPTPRVRIGANLGLHDHPNPIRKGDEYAPAMALDVEVGDFEEGVHLQAGVLRGENWRRLSEEGVPATFQAAQVIVTWKRRNEDGRLVSALEPVGRISVGDPDRSAAENGGLLVTPGFVVHLKDRNKVSANVDVWSPTSGAREWSVKLQTYLYF